MLNINNTPWHKLTSDDILALLASDNSESFFFEFKEDGVRNEQLYKEISAFANTYGGYILLGITDKKDVSGCVKWTEERVHNVLYNNITPTPDFDIKQLQIDGKTVIVIKIEEGSMPPYITSDGKICERISSSSMAITNSAKLSQLYAKHKDSLLKLDYKIGIEELNNSHQIRNLCGYIDVGFEVRCMDTKKVVKNFLLFDFTTVGEYLKKNCPAYSVSRVGNTCMITIGKLTRSDDNSSQYIPDGSMHNYIILMNDGSAKYRYCLFSDNEGYVELSALVSTLDVFRKIYEIVFKETLKDNFVYARRYEKLTVLKQFTPYYRDDVAELTGFVLSKHREKYGNSIVVSSTRIPINDYEVIDRRCILEMGWAYTIDRVMQVLFGDGFIAMGFVDIPEEFKENAMKRNRNKDTSSE